MRSLDRLVLLERACAALATLVRQEYPDAYTLAEIAETWGEGITPEQVTALAELGAEPLGEFGDDLVERVDVKAPDVRD